LVFSEEKKKMKGGNVGSNDKPLPHPHLNPPPSRGRRCIF